MEYHLIYSDVVLWRPIIIFVNNDTFPVFVGSFLLKYFLFFLFTISSITGRVVASRYMQSTSAKHRVNESSVSNSLVYKSLGRCLQGIMPLGKNKVVVLPSSQIQICLYFGVCRSVCQDFFLPIEYLWGYRIWNKY